MKNSPSSKFKNILFENIDSIFDSKEKYLEDPQTAFSRVQKISFRQTMLYPITTSSLSNSQEMQDFFPLDKLPSVAALSYRRNQVKVTAFEQLFRQFTACVLSKELFHGIRCIAADGTSVNTPYNPKDEYSHSNCISDRRGFNQLHLTTLYDIHSDCYVDAVIQGYHTMNEHDALCQMMDRYSLSEPALIIADRGFPSYNVIAHAERNHLFYLFRISASNARSFFPDLDDPEKRSSFDVTDVITIGRRHILHTEAYRNYHLLPKRRTYDYIEPGSTEIDTFSVRMLKFPISETQDEYIITNLPEDQFKVSDTKELYRQRWGIETSYRFLKYAEALSHIHSIKKNFIFQEIYAKLICYNFCSAVHRSVKSVKTQRKTRYEYAYDKTNLIRTCMKYLKGIKIDVEMQIRTKKVPVRANRQFKRNIRDQHADTLTYR